MTIDKNEYHTGEEILPLHQSRMTEQAKFTYFTLVEAFGKKLRIKEENKFKL